MKVKIIADSVCDLSKELINKYDIRIIPLGIIKENSEFRDGVDITPQDIFQYVDSGKGICHTVAVNINEYAAAYAEERPNCDAIIHFTISSDMSACCQNALVAAAEFDNVYVIDSRNLSTGIGHLVLDAAIMAERGIDPGEIKRITEENTGKVEASFVIDTIKYLHKGGRCSTLAAMGANLLQLKPCIEVVDGKMGVGKKYRGSIEKALKQYVEDRLSGRDDIDYRRIFITHTIERELVEKTIELIKKYADFEEIIDTDAGCTVSNHCGPRTLGILFYRK